jgi:hypothetical protein
MLPPRQPCDLTEVKLEDEYGGRSGFSSETVHPTPRVLDHEAPMQGGT